MANVNAPFGLRPVKHTGGASWNQQTNVYYIAQADTNAYGIGDTVISAATGDLTTGISGVTLSAARGAVTTGNIRGVIVGIGTAPSTPGGNFPGAFDPNNLNIAYIPATKTQAYYVWVVDDPTVIFEAQADSGTLASTALNKNIGYTNTAPTSSLTTSGGVLHSATVLTTASANTTQALPLKVVGAPWTPDNDLTSGYARFYVVINQHELAGNTAGV
jgi:hypothetical protein